MLDTWPGWGLRASSLSRARVCVRVYVCIGCACLSLGKHVSPEISARMTSSFTRWLSFVLSDLNVSKRGSSNLGAVCSRCWGDEEERMPGETAMKTKRRGKGGGWKEAARSVLVIPRVTVHQSTPGRDAQRPGNEAVCRLPVP